MKHLLAEYCRLLAGAPVGVTSVRDPTELRRVHVDDPLTALPLVERLAPGCMVDVGSGGGSPGIPLAIATGIRLILVESRDARARFLRETARALELDCEVVHERSETLARGSGRDAFDLALARALAPPPAAAELCLPLVRPSGHVILWTANLEPGSLSATAALVAGELAEVVPTEGARSLALLRKLGPTPERFPRRAGQARRRPP
ncbi:MAG: RsmG family class I SAM-dependent methyltransferase [Gaiellales bacterium]